MDNKKILLVNLSKGRTGELNSKLLGMVFVMKFQAAAMSRSNIPEDERVDFSLYVDEFQNFSTDSFATIMSEARKYHLNLIVANQFTTQLTQEIRDAVFGNMGTIVSFRIGQNDVESLSRYFQPIFDGDDLLRIPNYNTIVRTLIGGVPTQPFSMATLPALGTPNPRLSEALKQLSAAKYGRPKAEIEKEINERMRTKETPRPASSFGGAPAFGGQSAASPYGASGARPAPAPATTGTGSFLDEWLNKRRTGMPPPSGAQIGPSTPAQPLPAAPAVQATETPASAPPAAAPTQLTQPPEPAATSSADETKEADGGTKNISSDEIEQSEVDKIAAELRQQLDQPKEPAKKVADDQEHHIELKPGKEDTIFIDPDGNLKMTDLPG